MELFPITVEPVVDRIHPDSTIGPPPFKNFEYFRIFSNVSHHFSKVFEYFQMFSNVFERFGLKPRRLVRKSKVLIDVITHLQKILCT